MTTESTTKPKILCVDDERAVLEALRRLLRSDFRVVTAESGEEALNLLESHPDLAVILSDYRMEGLSGIELLRRSRSIVPNAVRAILSGQIELKQISEAINRAEIHRLILKPWDNEYLRIQMQEAVLTHSTLVEKNQLRQLAITDPVTGLTNHRYFQERLQDLWRKGLTPQHPMSLLMIDIDNFKSVNDKYGHLAGDQVLAEVAERLVSSIGDSDSVSRYGGEEFSLILTDTDSGGAGQRADKIRQAIESEKFTIANSQQATLTVSIGVTTYPGAISLERPTDLIAQADHALYRAKNQGRNQVLIYDPTLDRN
ncbi:MAG: diguanylate cyclase [Bdellovibrionaceae bacterium]|nr:diguanylate cyclase [Bdellovibrionales bacterium]MCB9084806.1 diguanylate cyclase [Pseudobdellovibrionaceae bacterium]